MQRRFFSADRESGQVATVLIIIVLLGLVFVSFRVILPIGEATDQKAGAQAAADAAALAAAQQIGEDLPGVLADAVRSARTAGELVDLLSGLTASSGRGEAAGFASRNGSRLTLFNYSRFTDEIEVEVEEQRTAQTGTRAVARATAALGLRLGACDLTEDPSPDPPVVDPSDTAPEPDPSPDSGVTLRCGDLELRFTIAGANGQPTLDGSIDDLGLDNLIEPRLVR